MPNHTRDPAFFHLLICAIAVSMPPTFSIVLLARLTILLVFIGRELYAEYAILAAQNAAPAPAAVINVFATLFILKSSVIFVNFIFPTAKRYYSSKITKAKDLKYLLWL